jgi:cyclopropane fatty-acyl-phospholipid synthase-like methyltransferase
MSTITHASGDDWDGLWADYGDSSQVNPAQEYRRRLLVRRLRVGGMSRVVDIGSGQGDLALMLRQALPSVEIVGLELGASGVEQARA